MPNWIEGTMKLRGKPQDIKRFFLEGISLYQLDIETLKYQKLGKDKWFILKEFEDSSFDVSFKDTPYIEGTHRAFIDDLNISFTEDKRKENNVLCFSMRQAWSFKPENYFSIAKKFDLDIRLYGIEQGMEFVQEVEISKAGVLISNDVREFKDWDWECPFPNMGG